MNIKKGAPLNPIIRIITAMVLVVTAGLIKNLPVLSIAAAFAALCLAYLKVFKGKRIGFIFAVILISFSIATMQALSNGNEVLAGISIWGLHLNIYREGLNLGILMFVRIFLSYTILAVLMTGMRLSDFVGALRFLRLPAAFIEVIVLACKYIYIFGDDIRVMRKAHKARLGYSGFYSSAIATGNIAGVVLLRALDRSRTLTKSMKSRGYDGSNLLN